MGTMNLEERSLSLQKVLEEKIAFADQREATALLGEHDEYLQVLMDNFDS